MRRAIRRANEVLDILYGKRPIAPIDLSALFYKHNVDLIRAPLDKVDGLLYRRHRRALMVINNQVHPLRQRFSEGHEWGHYFLHPHIELSLDIQKDSYYDYQANRFAEELLMPETLFRRLYTELWVTDRLHINRHLSRIFAVSRPAVRVRIEHLNLLNLKRCLS